MVVHHVEVDEVGAGREHVPDLVAEPREVGREDRRRDAIIARIHGVHGVSRSG